MQIKINIHIYVYKAHNLYHSICMTSELGINVFLVIYMKGYIYNVNISKIILMRIEMNK